MFCCSVCFSCAAEHFWNLTKILLADSVQGKLIFHPPVLSLLTYDAPFPPGVKLSFVCPCYTELCKTFQKRFKNHPQNVPLPTPKLHYEGIFQPDISLTWQECFYATLYWDKMPWLLEGHWLICPPRERLMPPEGCHRP